MDFNDLMILLKLNVFGDDMSRARNRFINFYTWICVNVYVNGFFSTVRALVLFKQQSMTTAKTTTKKKILHKIALLLLLWLDIFGLSIPFATSKRFRASLVSTKCVWWPVFVFIRLLCVCVFVCIWMRFHSLFISEWISKTASATSNESAVWKRLRSLFAFFFVCHLSLA